MIDEAEAESLRDELLEILDRLVVELDDAARFDVDQMVVVLVGRGFIAHAAAFELAPLEDARLLEQPHRPIDRGDRDVAVDHGGAPVQFLDVGVIIRIGKHARDDPALFGDAQSPFGAERFEVDAGGAHPVHIVRARRRAKPRVDASLRPAVLGWLRRGLMATRPLWFERLAAADWKQFMSRICELTGKGRQIGHNVSHANNKTKRTFLPNLQNVTLISDTLGRSVRLRVSMNGLRSVEHVGGLDMWLLKTRDEQLSLTARRLKREIVKKTVPAAA